MTAQNWAALRHEEAPVLRSTNPDPVERKQEEMRRRKTFIEKMEEAYQEIYQDRSVGSRKGK